MVFLQHLENRYFAAFSSASISHFGAGRLPLPELSGALRPLEHAAEFGILSNILLALMWGAARLKQQVEKNAFWTFDGCRVAVVGARRLRPRQKWRSGACGTARSERQSRRCGPARSGRADRSSGTAGRTRSAQSHRAGHSKQLPGRGLHGLVPRRRSAGERLLRTGAKSSDVPRRTAGLMRCRGECRQCAAGCDLCYGAAITA